MKKLNTEAQKTLIIGGAKSGKTRCALEIATPFISTGAKGLYCATCQAQDSEMAEKIRRHREERGDLWYTLEEPLDIPGAIDALNAQYPVYVIDCLTLWTANLMWNTSGEERHLFHKFVDWIHSTDKRLVIVTGEVGLGLVPEHPMSRRYRELLGELNQMVANAVDLVYMVVAGQKLKLKGV